ncbi:MAG: hypothetical protein V1722_00435 [Candidatus Micrarchaeota archaeon]
MAKVVLVWNEHPTEVVAGFHARKVAAILREKYGHEVVLEKIPVKETNYGIATALDSGTSALNIAAKIDKLKPSIQRARELAEKHSAVVFNFHAAESARMADADKKEPKEFRVMNIKDSEEHYPAEITIQAKDREQKHHVIELPGIQINLPTKKREKALERIRKILEAAKHLKRSDPVEKYITQVRLNVELHEYYHAQRMAVTDSAQKKYLSPAISEKIAAAIHERITRQR